MRPSVSPGLLGGNPSRDGVPRVMTWPLVAARGKSDPEERASGDSGHSDAPGAAGA